MWQKEDFTDTKQAYHLIAELVQQGYRTVNDREPVLRPGFSGVSWGHTSEGKLLFYTNSRQCFSGYAGYTSKQKAAAKAYAEQERQQTRTENGKDYCLPNLSNNDGLMCPVHTVHWPKTAKYAAIDQYGYLIFFQGKRPVYDREAG